MSSLYKKSLSIIGDNKFKHLGINEINKSTYDKLQSNISNFAIENNSFILYLTYQNNELLPFEKELKKFITENNIDNSFVYLDINSLESLNSINQLIKDFSQSDLKFNQKDIPLFLYFQGGKITNIIINYNLNIEQVKNKFIELGVIE